MSQRVKIVRLVTTPRLSSALVLTLLVSIFLHGVKAQAEVRKVAPAPKTTVAGAATPTPRSNAVAANEAGAKTASQLSRLFEDRALHLLERYLPAKEFQVTATVTPTTKQVTTAPYDPRGLSASSLATLDPDQLDTFVKSIQIDVLINSRLNSSRKNLEELLFKSLRLKRNRGDRVTFGNLGIEVESEEWIKERNDLKDELARQKTEVDRLNRELETAQIAAKEAETAAKLAANNAEKNAANGSAGAAKKETDTFWKDFLNKNARLIWIGSSIAGVLGLIALIALLLFLRSFSQTGKNLAGALTTIGQSMETMGGSFASAAQFLSDRQNPAIASLEAKMISEGKASGHGMSGMALDSIQNHMLKMRKEILEGINESAEGIVLKHLSQLATTPAGAGKALLTMELLGRDMATHLFQRLGIAAQEALMKFLHGGNSYAGSKFELMLEAGEELKTRLMAESFDKIRGGPSDKIAERLIQLTDAEILQVARDLDPNVLPRLFRYLEAGKIAILLTNLKRFDEQKFEATISILPRMAEAENVEQYDEEIMRALEAIIGISRADAQRPFLKVYQEIVEGADDEVGENIVKQLSQDPRLDTFFKENVINLHTFFRISSDARAQIIETLSNRDVAALASGVKEEEQDMVLDNLPERRRDLVMEEFDSLNSRGGRQAATAFKKAKDIVVRKMRDMKADGSLAEVLQGSEGERKKKVV